MSDEREREENEPKIRIVDRRMLNEDERAGKAAPAAEETTSAPPRLEIVGGTSGANVADIASEADSADILNAGPVEAAGGDEEYDEGDAPSAEEIAQMRAEVEQEQFAAIEERMGRPLTEQEKDSVRAEMDNQARSMSALEIAPMLQQFMAEMSARAAVHMGLMPNPYTRLIAKNDAEARLAIDSFAAVLEVAKPRLDATSQREYARVLNDLRVNFVSQTGLSMSGPSKIIH
ncbi:MAG TPA: DUF1844 domain-containing protein [Abditibacteriaceae bacterium]